MKIAIAGSSGRMGRTLIEAVLSSADLKLSAALEIASSPQLGKDAGEALGSACGSAGGAEQPGGRKAGGADGKAGCRADTRRQAVV